MKASRLISAFLLLALTASSPALAQESPSVEKGRTLFNDPGLGATGKSCSSCHSNGKDLPGGNAPHAEEGDINWCTENALKGHALQKGSVEMKSLLMYIESLREAAKEKK